MQQAFSTMIRIGDSNVLEMTRGFFPDGPQDEIRVGVREKVGGEEWAELYISGKAAKQLYQMMGLYMNGE